MKKSFIFIFLFFILVSYASATQIILINETEEQIYTLDNVEISGDLETNKLKISGSGEIIEGENVKVYLFGPASDILIKNLMVNGKATTVSFNENGYFFVADKGRIEFQGDLEIRTIGQIVLYAHGPINELNFNLKHGYAVNGDRFGVYNERIVIQRSEKIAMLIDGSFRYTYAERNEFYYIINFKAFGKSLGNYILDLPNNEVVTSVTGVLKWEQSNNKLLLDFKSSNALVTIKGLFDSDTLRIPLKEGSNHVLIESDPEKKISISTTAREIDLSESPIPPQYSNARAFIASKDDVFQITIKKLGVLPSLAASVSSAINRIAITSKGSIVGELNYNYANTGVDYIEIDVEGTPLYASTERSAVKLTRDKKLLLSFPKTNNGYLDLVYFTTTNPLGPVSIVDIPLAKTDLPITTVTTYIYLPKEYIVIETFGATGGSELPSVDFIILFFVIVSLLAFTLKKNKRFIFCYSIFSIGLFYFNLGLFILLISISLVIIARRYLPEKFEVKWIIAGAVLFVALLMLLIVPFVIWQMGIFKIGGGGVRTEIAYPPQVSEIPTTIPRFKGFQEIGKGEGAITVPIREGVLPVKLELPRLGKTITVRNYLVTKEKQINLRVFIVAEWFKYIFYLISLLAGIWAYKEYKKE